MSDAGLAGILADDRVEVFVLYGDGAPAGYSELDRRGQAAVNRGTIDLAYFGLMPHGVGRGLGRYLLHAALEQAWSYAPERLTVNTNTMDHPRALPLYQKAGFAPYRQEEQERSEENTSELQSLMRISYAVFCLKKKKTTTTTITH